jgi:hypothetical protein
LRDPRKICQVPEALDKINKIMKDINLPEFGNPSDFIDIINVLNMYVEQDSLWAKECEKVADVRLGQVTEFTEHLIRAKTMLQQLNSTLIKYGAHVVDIRRIYAAPMEQHKFPWAHTCEELFIIWSNYERILPFQETTWVDC